MISNNLSIFRSIEDKNDCLFFKEVSEELERSKQHTTLPDGEQLMPQCTGKTKQLSNVLFLNLNLPRKNGFTCLEEINHSIKLKALPDIKFFVSCDEHMAGQLYENGGQHSISKPADFSPLKEVIYNEYIRITKNNHPLPG